MKIALSIFDSPPLKGPYLTALGFTWGKVEPQTIAEQFMLYDVKRDPDNKNELPAWIRVFNEPSDQID